jgi:hypothetical protein
MAQQTLPLQIAHCKEVILQGEISPKISKYRQICMFRFQCISLNIEGLFTIFTPHLVYNQMPFHPTSICSNFISTSLKALDSAKSFF